MQVGTLLTWNMHMPIRVDPCGRNIAWSKNKDGTLVDSSLEESYFWALTQSFTLE